MRLAAAKLPCTTEVVDKTSLARLGFADVEHEKLAPRVTTLGAVHEQERRREEVARQVAEVAATASTASTTAEAPPSPASS